jgi:hypothetical protein
MGTGSSPVLYASNWGATLGPSQTMSKSASSSANEFTLTLDLYQGDQFQLATGDWGVQRGGGYLVSRTLSDGTEVFSTATGIGSDPTGRKSNISVQLSGNYTFTLTTNPADDTADTANNNPNVNPWDKIAWTRNGDPVVAAVSQSFDYYIKGATITDWKDIYSFYDAFSPITINQVYTKSIYLRAGEEFLLTSRSTDAATGEVSTGSDYVRFGDLDSASAGLFSGTSATSNMKTVGAGLYNFTLDLSKTSGRLSATVDTSAQPTAEDYYLNGTIGGASWDMLTGADGNFTSTWKLVSDGTDSYSISATLAAGEQFTVNGFIAGSANPGNGWVNQTTGYNYTYMAAGNAAFTAADPSSGNYNITCVTAGKYKVSINSYSKVITITAE